MTTPVTIVMNAPAGYGGVITGMPSGTIYTVPASGVVTVQFADIGAFTELGFQAAPNTVANVGTPATGVTAVEYGDAYDHTTILTIDSVLPAIAGGAALAVGKLLYTLPAGAQIIESSQISVAITQTQGNITADTPDVGLGTTIASGAVSVLGGTAGFENILTGQTAADCDGTPTVKTLLATSSPFSVITEASGAKTIYFNVADTWAASGDAAAELTGTVTLNWKQMGA